MFYTMKDITSSLSITPPTVYDFIKKQEPDFISAHKVKDKGVIKYDEEFYKLIKEKYGTKSATDSAILPADNNTSAEQIASLTAELEAMKKEKADREKSIIEERIAELEKRVLSLEEEKRSLQQQNGELLFIIRTKEEKEKALLMPPKEEQKKGIFHWFHNKSER